MPETIEDDLRLLCHGSYRMVFLIAGFMIDRSPGHRIHLSKGVAGKIATGKLTVARQECDRTPPDPDSGHFVAHLRMEA